MLKRRTVVLLPAAFLLDGCRKATDSQGSVFIVDGPDVLGGLGVSPAEAEDFRAHAYAAAGTLLAFEPELVAVFKHGSVRLIPTRNLPADYVTAFVRRRGGTLILNPRLEGATLTYPQGSGFFSDIYIAIRSPDEARPSDVEEVQRIKVLSQQLWSARLQQTHQGTPADPALLLLLAYNKTQEALSKLQARWPQRTLSAEGTDALLRARIEQHQGAIRALTRLSTTARQLGDKETLRSVPVHIAEHRARIEELTRQLKP
jgi:hypothetical protein